MVVVSGTNNAGDSRGRAGEEEADFAFDLRLARRWKRRRVAYENFRPNSCSKKALKTTIHQNNKSNYAFVEATTVESDSGNSLNHIEDFVDLDAGIDTDARCVDYTADDDDSDDNFGDTFDPHYMMFLDNLKEDGKSYVLEHALGETSVVVKYEKEEDVNNELNMENLKTIKCHLRKRKLETQNVLKGHSKKERIESPRRVLRSNSSRQSTKSPSVNCRTNTEAKKIKSPQPVLFSNSGKRKIGNTRTTLRCKSKRKFDENPSIMHDVVNREKIEIPRTLRSNSRREDNENSSILHDLLKIVKAESARTLRVLRRESMRTQKYTREPVVEKNAQKEVKDPVSSEKKLRESMETQKFFMEPVVKKNVEKEAEHPISSAKNGCTSERHSQETTNSDLVDESYLEFLKFLKDGQHLECIAEGGKRVAYEESDSGSVIEKKKEAEDPVSSAKNGCSSKRQCPEATNSVEHQCSPGIKSNLVDESYEEYLKLLKDGQHLECIFDGGEKVVYDDSDSDSEVAILDYNPFSDGKHVPFIDLDGEECIENSGSEFKVELMEILQKPYDRMEYEKLWEEASCRRPMQGLRILRSNMISYQLDSNGKSYLELDGYSDLASVIDQARGDKCRILNLLRGFFYWLQNLAHEGAFKPWLDSSCLSILPPVELEDLASGSVQRADCAV